MSQITYPQSDRVKKDIDTFRLFDLGDLLPDRRILVNVSISVVSLLVKEYGSEVRVLAQRVLSESQMRVMLPLLSFPSCCPQEVLQASYYCTYEVLLRSFLSPDANAIVAWNELVHEYRSRLVEAKEKGTRRKEMRGVYNALFSCRQKLEELSITIRSRKDGYYLAPLVHK